MATQCNRKALLFLATICFLSIGVALYFQYYQEMEPCPLCIFQRVAIMAAGVVLALMWLAYPILMVRRIGAGLLALISAAGIGLSIRHLWLQSLPEDQVPACGPGLEYMLEAFPFREVLDMVLKGSGECATINWQWLGLTIPGWTLLLFLFVGLVGWWAGWRRVS